MRRMPNQSGIIQESDNQGKASRREAHGGERSAAPRSGERSHVSLPAIVASEPRIMTDHRKLSSLLITSAELRMIRHLPAG
jgi:hypothetical protein